MSKIVGLVAGLAFVVFGEAANGQTGGYCLHVTNSSDGENIAVLTNCGSKDAIFLLAQPADLYPNHSQHAFTGTKPNKQGATIAYLAIRAGRSYSEGDGLQPVKWWACSGDRLPESKNGSPVTYNTPLSGAVTCARWPYAEKMYKNIDNICHNQPAVCKPD
ncbi:MAG: hypothetical protein KGJ53_04545 [Alphaproteobacteria bacterium]|nr:hypothetical protein [Alphaproteobacteria bacterium]